MGKEEQRTKQTNERVGSVSKVKRGEEITYE